MNIDKPFLTYPLKVNPSEPGFVTSHDQEVLSLSRPDEFPVMDETLYKDFVHRINERAFNPDGTPLWGNYRVWDGKQVGEGVIQYFWKKVKTDAERNRPFHFDRITQKIFWDPVLERIEFGQETKFPLSQNTVNSAGRQAIITAPRWLVRRWYRPGHTFTTIIEIEHFLSDVPFTESMIESDEPQPTEVAWDLVGSSGSMGKCLHPKVEVPAQGGGYRIIASSGPVESGASDGSKSQIFPKTNHHKRRDYTVCQVESTEGQWHLMKMLFKAPRYQRLIYNS